MGKGWVREGYRDAEKLQEAETVTDRDASGHSLTGTEPNVAVNQILQCNSGVGSCGGHCHRGSVGLSVHRGQSDLPPASGG